MNVRRVHLRIEGYVQGVNFRHTARVRAQSLGLGGWVRNCPDGTVEAEAEGEEAAVQQFIAWAHRGPSMAEVHRVDVEERSPEGDRTFRVAG